MEVNAEIIAGISAAFTTLAGVITWLFKSREKLVTEKIELERQLADYKSQKVFVEYDNIRLRTELEKLAGTDAVDAVIVVDSSGIIKSWSPGCIVTFYYSSKDVLGRHFFLLVPKSARDDIHKTWDKFASSSGKVPERGPFDLMALRRDNVEIPVSMTLSCYDNHGARFVRATFRPRVVNPDIDSLERSNP